MESSCPPPSRFIAAVEVKRAVLLTHQPPFIHRSRSRGRFAVGVRYERRVHEYLAAFALGRPELDVRVGQWIEFLDKTGKRWCQVDALLVDRERKICTICEVKYQHTSDAWWQLRWLYLPVLEKALPDMRFRLVEIVHWHDPATAFPERYRLIRSLDEANEASIGVHLFNPRREDQLLKA